MYAMHINHGMWHYATCGYTKYHTVHFICTNQYDNVKHWFNLPHSMLVNIVQCTHQNRKSTQNSSVNCKTVFVYVKSFTLTEIDIDSSLFSHNSIAIWIDVPFNLFRQWTCNAIVLWL